MNLIRTSPFFCVRAVPLRPKTALLSGTKAHGIARAGRPPLRLTSRKSGVRAPPRPPLELVSYAFAAGRPSRSQGSCITEVSERLAADGGTRGVVGDRPAAGSPTARARAGAGRRR